ncbi:hypothetical protein [Puerhibacterium sp. TATVAM-FAB25]|uniref:hypothetical protein n=1 Tax=Puerhibacterium sp. TATVAM-FAB25 TaxID=3093699 RepID=UPI00397B7609
MTSSTWDPSTEAEVAYRTERARRAYAGQASLDRSSGWVRAAARQWWDLWVRGTAWVAQGGDRVGDTLDGVAAQHDGSWDEYVARRAAEIERGLDGMRPERAARTTARSATR